MFRLGVQALGKKKKQLLAFFIFFILVYTLIDSFNMSYQAMARDYGVLLVAVNVLLNVVMASLTAVMMTLSGIHMHQRGHETKSQNLGFLSLLFGILTYGCTPCVIGFFASVGISFSVMVLPFAGLPYKLISLLLILVGLVWTRHEMNKPCPIPSL